MTNTDTDRWLSAAVGIAAVGVMRAAVEAGGGEFTAQMWLAADEENRELARRTAQSAIDALRTAGMLATPEHRAAIIRELVGTDEEEHGFDRAVALLRDGERFLAWSRAQAETSGSFDRYPIATPTAIGADAYLNANREAS